MASHRSSAYSVLYTYRISQSAKPHEMLVSSGWLSMKINFHHKSDSLLSCYEHVQRWICINRRKIYTTIQSMYEDRERKNLINLESMAHHIKENEWRNQFNADTKMSDFFFAKKAKLSKLMSFWVVPFNGKLSFIRLPIVKCCKNLSLHRNTNHSTWLRGNCLRTLFNRWLWVIWVSIMNHQRDICFHYVNRHSIQWAWTQSA